MKPLSLEEIRNLKPSDIVATQVLQQLYIAKEDRDSLLAVCEKALKILFLEQFADWKEAAAVRDEMIEVVARVKSR